MSLRDGELPEEGEDLERLRRLASGLLALVYSFKASNVPMLLPCTCGAEEGRSQGKPIGAAGAFHEDEVVDLGHSIGCARYAQDEAARRIGEVSLAAEQLARALETFRGALRYARGEP